MKQPVNIDEDPMNADWLKAFRWPESLPPYRSPEFMAYLKRSGMTLDRFRQLPVYRYAVRRGDIVNDEWVGGRGARHG